MAKKNSNAAGIVLLAKQSGLTSYSSLNAVKKALGTSKVGHTGTLDSFAQGLLVVCVGNLTRLSSHITAFNKTYEAVIEFGKETDTLDPTGEVVRTAELPELQELLKAVEKHKGAIEQVPPAFSALHVDGKRASDLVREGHNVELEKRLVFIMASRICELKFDDGTNISFKESPSDEFEKIDFNEYSDILCKKVHYARIRFEVSKGTYIRSLARDIGQACGSAAFLDGLLRTRISCFDLKDAAGIDLLKPFTIDSVLLNLNSIPKGENFDYIVEEVKNKIQTMTSEIAEQCGLPAVCLNSSNEIDFYNGRPLKQKMFTPIYPDKEFIDSDGNSVRREKAFFADNKYSVFLENLTFAGVIHFEKQHISYDYVIPRGVKQ